MTPAFPIQLSSFRQIFLWPLAAAPTEDLKAAIGGLAERIESPWEPVVDPLRYLEEEETDGLSQEAYAEFVYFHGFVQRFLFAKNSTAVRLFERKDIRQVEVQLKPESEPNYLQVDRLHLYLFDIGVAVFAVETSTNSISLGEALTLGDYTRRAYPPFWDGGGRPGLYPQRIAWYDKEGNKVMEGSGEERSEFIEHVRDKRCAPVARHWRGLLPEAFSIDGYADGGDLIWRHVVDERMPTMTFAATRQVSDISRGDWVRLCFVDEEGGAGLPYSEGFLEDFEAKHAYDRFWPGDSRILISGYGFTMVTNDSGFALGVLQTHFRRHYFQMGLTVHFQTAALLAISGGLSQAVSNDVRDAKFERRVDELRRTLLSFTHRYWFTGLSNQLQAQELCDLWRRHLGLKTLYDEVGAEAREVDQYLRSRREEEIAKADKGLTRVANLGVPVALALGFLGINVIVGQEGGWTDWDSWRTVSAVGAVFFMFVAGLMLLMESKEWESKKVVFGIGAMLLVIAVVLYCLK